MTDPLRTEPTPNPKQSTIRVSAARVRAFQLSCAVAVALLFLVGNVYADIFVSNFGNGTIEVSSS